MQVHPERPPPAYHWNGHKVSPLTLQPVKRLIFQENLGFCVNLLIFKMWAIKSTFKWHVSENKQTHVHVCPQQHSCPLMEEWIHKLVCPHNGMWLCHRVRKF